MKINYEIYVKQRYIKLLLNNKIVELDENWEKGIIAEQYLFILSNKLTENALKILNGISEDFVESFSLGKPIEYTQNNIHNINYFLRAQNFLNKLIITHNLNKGIIENIINGEKNKSMIDVGIYKYYLGNKIVLQNIIDIAQDQIIAINNSLSSSFKNNKQEIENQKNELIPVFNKTNEDINDIIDKMNKYLFCSEILKKIGE